MKNGKTKVIFHVKSDQNQSKKKKLQNEEKEPTFMNE
jgi:hypothetical protein